MFNQQKTEALYIYFKDKIGNDSIFIFMEDPATIPVKMVGLTVDALKSGGATDIKIIYPK